jgi:hypothetical protein
MEPGTDLNAKRPDFIGNGAGAAHAARPTVEGGKNAVADRLDLMTAKACASSSRPKACRFSQKHALGLDPRDHAQTCD